MSEHPPFVNILQQIADRISEGMSEKDVENAFLNEGFYSSLGYRGAGHDLRSEMTLSDNRRPDYITLDSTESVTAVYEFKAPGRDLDKHRDQLFHYLDALKADYGVLTNGEQFHLYRYDSGERIEDIQLIEAAESEANDIEFALRKPEWDFTDPDSLDEFLSGLDQVELINELGREHFFDTFRLDEGSPFAELVTGMMELLSELRDERDAKFVTGAFDFWDASYASTPHETPESWEPFVNGEDSLKDFMFCLESSHALLSRLLLAKATEDHDFFPQDRGMEQYFRTLGGFSDTINTESYPVAANGLIEDMREDLVTGLFEDDIFIWWTDGFSEVTSTQHDTPLSRIEGIAGGDQQVTQISPVTRDRFSLALAKTMIAVLKFDFSAMEGDLLGDLYQRYFDPETRKALGEFYTPQEVVEYIMDGVGYDVGVSSQQLMDPATGSGTFLVEAVHRYLDDVRRYNDDPDWEKHLTELCTRPRMVGLDIHPFAVLMAQIRFMVAILPEYREAKRANENFTLRRLPIFRTDSLQNERELTGADLGEDGSQQLTLQAITEDNQDVRVPVPLPIEVDEEAERPGVETEDGFLVKRIRMPLFETIRLQTGVSNFGEYFAALQGVLDVVKAHMVENEWEYLGGLKTGIGRYTTREYEGVEDFFAPYVNDMLSLTKELRQDHGDGRLFKMFEDTVLGLVVKNYMEYDYVVGNPPYVRIQHLPDSQKAMMDTLYDSATGNYDIYCPFYERGMDWLVEGSGKLGYITPNQFMVTEYGQGLREVLLKGSSIEEVYDFRDSGVFEDATNYPAIVILEDEPDERNRTDNSIRCVRVKAKTDNENGRKLDEAIIHAVRKHRDVPGYSDEFIDVFDFPQEKLNSGNYWSLMPPKEFQVFEKLEMNQQATIGNVTDAVFQGIRTSANKIYVVDVLDADRVESDDQGSTVTIVPTGDSQEYEVETDLLRPFLKGSDVERWRGNWSGLHVIFPYHIDEDESGEKTASLYTEKELSEQLPLTWDYFESHEEDLRARENGNWEDSDNWWEFGRVQNLEKFETPKTIQAEIANSATFMLDEIGTWYFTTAYGVTFKDSHRGITDVLSCQLNSTTLDFYLKHIAVIKAGGYYSYRTQYVDKLPCIVRDKSGNFGELRESANDILRTIERRSRTRRFPEAYLGQFKGQIEYLDYEWETRRYPVNAQVEELNDGRFAVTAGRSDEITNALIDQGNREERQLRARYVHATVNGRNFKKGEVANIPIPANRDGIEELIDRFNEDQQTVAMSSIEESEEKINEAVYDLFELDDDERKVIEDYLEVF